MTAQHLSRGDWARALLVILIWGTNFVAMKFGLLTLSPMLLSALRFVVASLPFLLFVRPPRSEEHTSELQSQSNLVCRLLLEKKKKEQHNDPSHGGTAVITNCRRRDTEEMDSGYKRGVKS